MNTEDIIIKDSDLVFTVITPVYNEAESLPHFHEQLLKVINKLGIKYEWIIVDDHSNDSTNKIIKSIAEKNIHIHGIRLAKNYGSHIAISAGLHLANGDSAIVMAADLQDPPGVIPELIEKWRHGKQIVWAVRSLRRRETPVTKGTSRLYYWLMRKVVKIKDLHLTGADFFLIDRKVIDAFKLFKESNLSIFLLLTWMGFKQDNIFYIKQARQYGESGWTLRKKIKLVVDSITSFSHFPIRTMTYIGFIIAFGGLIYAMIIIYNALLGDPAPGWSSLLNWQDMGPRTIMVVLLVLGGFQMIMLGVLGEYIWRNLDESRRRPLYLIEENIGSDYSGKSEK